MSIVGDVQQDQLPLDGLTTSAERHDRGLSKGVLERFGGMSRGREDARGV